MTKLIISISMLSLTNMMFFLKTPLSMGFMILLQTLLSCMITGILMNTYWFSYILFLTFLGGLLVLFIYVSSISSNEMFKFSFNLLLFNILVFLMLIMIYLFFNFQMLWMNFFNNYEMKSFIDSSIFFNNENKISLIKLYNKSNNMMFMLIMYLLISLIAIVKITNINFGPLRMMN